MLFIVIQICEWYTFNALARVCIVGEEMANGIGYGRWRWQKMYKIKLKRDYAGSAISNTPQTKESEWSYQSHPVYLRFS